MAVVFSLLFFASLLALIIGLIRPRWVLPIQNPTRPKALALYAVASRVCIIAATSLMPPPKPAEQATADAPSQTVEAIAEPTTATTPETSESAAPTKTLGMPASEFVEKFNAVNRNNDLQHELSGSGEINEGPVKDTCQFAYGPKTACVLSISKDAGEVIDITLIGQDMDVVGAFGCLIQTLSPHLSREQRGQVLKDLGLFGKDLPEKGETTRDSIRYWTSSSPQIGLWLGASPLKQNGQ